MSASSSAKARRAVFLINHDFGVERFLPIIAHVREAFPALWLGVNFLAVTGKDAFPVLGTMQRDGITVDGYWADDARIDERRSADDQNEAREIAVARAASSWSGFYTGGTCFKKQREVPPEHMNIRPTLATAFMDAVCTSGIATGHAADTGKIAHIPQRPRRSRHDAGLRHYAGKCRTTTWIRCRRLHGGDRHQSRRRLLQHLRPPKLARLIRLTRDHGARS